MRRGGAGFRELPDHFVRPSGLVAFLHARNLVSWFGPRSILEAFNTRAEHLRSGPEAALWAAVNGLRSLTPREEAALVASAAQVAIACHLHVPEIVAVGMGACLCWTPEGGRLIRRMSGRVVEEGRVRGAWAASTRWRAARR
jgi:hypothetical protein